MQRRPDVYLELAQEAKRAGLLTGRAIERLIEEAVRREAGKKLLDGVQRLRDTNAPPLTEEDVAAELKAAADLIVTGDADLLTVESYQRIPVVTPAEALRRLEVQKLEYAAWRVEEAERPFTTRSA